MKRRLIAAALAAGAFGARADLPPQALLPAYRSECGACHVAFPPALLPAASWARLMANLPTHFGSDASLDAATQKTISDWLAAHAGSARKVRRETAPPTEDRITRAAWFVREHDEVPAAVWRRPDVRSASNCSACHRQADQGNFDEHDVRIPR